MPAVHGTPEEAIEGLDWWHVIEVAPGAVTPGSWDLRPVVGLMSWPGSLCGLRCLDVGTMAASGHSSWSRRGAGEVVAIDLVDPARQESYREVGHDRPGTTAADAARVLVPHERRRLCCTANDCRNG